MTAVCVAKVTTTDCGNQTAKGTYEINTHTHQAFALHTYSYNKHIYLYAYKQLGLSYIYFFGGVKTGVSLYSPFNSYSYYFFFSSIIFFF